MKQLTLQQSPSITGISRSTDIATKIERVSHPNPTYYKIQLRTINDQQKTLLLSQSFHPGWKAYVLPKLKSQNSMTKKIQALLPFLFGKELKEHVLVNNWSNGWTIKSQEYTVQSTQKNSTVNSELLTVYLFFLPQLLQWAGFVLLPAPFVSAWWMKKNILNTPDCENRCRKIAHNHLLSNK